MGTLLTDVAKAVIGTHIMFDKLVMITTSVQKLVNSLMLSDV
ncbi:hypothetical protein ACOWPH_16100 [Anabaena sp. PCC 7938]|uniref:Uncharacterized protein n=1 Tax=Anabaena cylindrica (strain ATCC 27899 / PCC 7122) TaxID=272123 RepID=K9ZML5_ANACC|nr:MULTISPECIES: hypothetical protein [Anabaena]AFZ59772.1 hypothetical protein Anacy_4412 [Anabaena cylindrica PCC 7122]BAY03178.1 hypothetical protein NIES19_24290 [Anabaena cylindrica PCC 7122]